MSRNHHDTGHGGVRIGSVDSDSIEPVASSSSSFATPLTDLPVDGAVDLQAVEKPRKKKICCVCGKDVAHEERFKDHSGRYWCIDCGTEDNHKKHATNHAADPIMCPDCHQTFQQGQMVEFDHVKICGDCVTKREKAAKRELARKAAAEQAARDAELQWKRMLTGATILAIIAVVWALYAIFL